MAGLNGQNEIPPRHMAMNGSVQIKMFPGVCVLYCSKFILNTGFNVLIAICHLHLHIVIFTFENIGSMFDQTLLLT